MVLLRAPPCFSSLSINMSPSSTERTCFLKAWNRIGVWWFNLIILLTPRRIVTPNTDPYWPELWIPYFLQIGYLNFDLKTGTPGFILWYFVYRSTFNIKIIKIFFHIFCKRYRNMSLLGTGEPIKCPSVAVFLPIMAFGRRPFRRCAVL